jgi:hypothetical protein
VSIFVVVGIEGQIVTTALPSGDMAVNSPASGPLNQLVFNICRYVAQRNQSYGGWIVPASKVGSVRLALSSKCRKISD